jgi:hypothetical protein
MHFCGIGVQAKKANTSRHLMFWYPKRCELESCDYSKKTGLMTCSACHMVKYCCKEHQKADWPMHKGDCQVFRKNQLRARFYTDEEILAEYPIRPKFNQKLKADMMKDPSVCRLCDSDETGSPKMRTSCCYQPICDNESEYEMFSYSREF